MVDESIERVVRQYLTALGKAGIRVHGAVLFGSHSKGTAHAWSDIDIVVIAPEFDRMKDRKLVDLLWELRAFTDPRIEPIPCGFEEWKRGQSDRPIIEQAFKEGVLIAA